VDAAEIAPVAHFYMGGVKIDEECATKVPGLYVAGEASAGLHGANRIEGNALSETQTQGAMAGENAAKYAARTSTDKVDAATAEAKREERLAPVKRSAGLHHWELRKPLQETMWTRIGVVRTGEGLESAYKNISGWKDRLGEVFVTSKNLSGNREYVEALETKNLLTLAELMAKAAIARKESRGSHYRRDFPEENNKDWLVNAVHWMENGEAKMRHDKVEYPYYDLDGNESRPE
jgi:succinate dehydrogenase/fumarate reductase flavoprotein subunit